MMTSGFVCRVVVLKQEKLLNKQLLENYKKNALLEVKSSRKPANM